MRSWLAVVLLMVAATSTGCDGKDRVPASPAPPTSGQPTAGPPTPGTPGIAVDKLAAMAPLDLIVNLGPASWSATYNGGAGIAVTPANWATAYEIPADAAATEIAAESRNNLRTAATEQWRFQPRGPKVGYSRMRLTIRQYASVARLTDAWWVESGRGMSSLGSINAPAGMRVLCSGVATNVSSDSSYYVGAYYADCLAFIGDTTVVYLSSTAPSATAAQSAVMAAVTQWYSGVIARAS